MTNLFIDFDSTICDSITAFCQSYDYKYWSYPNFKFANPDKVREWSFKDECSLIESPDEIFNSRYFFQVLTTFPNAVETLKLLNEKYNIIIATIGGYDNLAYKSRWIKSNLPFIHNVILMHNETCEMNKSLINMNEAIFIDDHINNLKSSNAKTKICFGKEFDWNRDWNGLWCKDWEEVGNLLL